MLKVARQVGSRNGLEKRRELRIDGGGARRQGLERHGKRQASLEPAPQRLRNARGDGGLDLR